MMTEQELRRLLKTTEKELEDILSKEDVFQHEDDVRSLINRISWFKRILGDIPPPAKNIMLSITKMLQELRNNGSLQQ